MEERQIRGSRKSCHRSGHRLRQSTVLVLIATGLAYVAQPGSKRSTEQLGQVAAIGCVDAAIGNHGGSVDCAEGESRPGAVSSPTEPYDGSQNSASPRGETGGADGPGWRDTQQPAPATTFAELCATGLNKTGLRCSTRTIGAIDNTAKTGNGRPAAGRHTISGRVLAADGFGLEGVTVRASLSRGYGRNRHPDGADISTADRTVTDPVGFYSFDGLPDGDYTIRTDAHGAYRSARISVRAGVQYADLLLLRDQAVFAQGQVLSAEGEPLEGVTVLPMVLGVPSVLTDNDGRYRLPVTLKPTVRTFTLRFQRPGFLEQYASVDARHLGHLDDTPVDVVMQPVEYWTAVNGTLTSSEGSALAGRTVQLRPVAQQRLYNAITNDEGEFYFAAVEAPVDYRLIVSAAPDHKDYQQQVHITADEARLDIVVEPYQFGEVSGRLVNLDGSPIPDFNLVLRNTASSAPNALLSSDAHGKFTVPAAPAGELVIASQSTPSILVRGVRLTPGEELHVPLVLDWGQHEIRGLVMDRYGNPVPASRILLTWSHQADGITTRATRRTAADAQGGFLFNELGPGPHSLEIDAPGFHTVALDHDASRQGYDLTVRMN